MTAVLQHPLSFTALSILLLLLACRTDKERAIADTEVPAAIISAFIETWPEALVKEYSEESDEGEIFYEIDFVFHDRDFTVKYDAAGRLQELEEGLAGDELPEPVYQAIARRYARFSVQKAEKKVIAGRITYEIKIYNNDSNETTELVFSPSGEYLGLDD